MSPVGGVVLRSPHFLVHALNAPSPLAGWMVVTSERHTRAVDTLEEPELAELGPLLARVMRAQKAALGAEHVYVFAIGDVLPHCHLHLIPRFASTPTELRGRAAFDASAEQMRPVEELAQAARKLAETLGQSSATSGN